MFYSIVIFQNIIAYYVILKCIKLSFNILQHSTIVHFILYRTLLIILYFATLFFSVSHYITLHDITYYFI